MGDHDDAPAILPQVTSELEDEDDRVSPEGFNLHITPDLNAIIASYACFIRLGMASYVEAYNGCLEYAWRRGSWGFNPTHLEELQDWVHARLGDEIELGG